MALVLRELFFDLSAWTTLTNATIVASSRNGSGAQLTTNGQATYRFPGAAESDWVTMGVAYQTANLSASRFLCALLSDNGATGHVSLTVTTGGAIEVRRGNFAGTVIGTSTTGVITAATWKYVEVQAKLHDTTGTVIVRVDGTERINLPTVDTKNAGTKTVFDAVIIASSSGVTSLFDDLYVATGAGQAFLGDTPILEQRNTRQQVRVATNNVITGVFANVWSGSAFVDAPVKVWSGSAFTDVAALKVWNGSAFVDAV